MEQVELKPCPFCGGEARPFPDEFGTKDKPRTLWSAICDGDCQAFLDCRQETEAEAIDAWNTRTTDQAKDEEIARGHAAIWLLASIHKAMDAFEAGDLDTAGVDADAWKEASRALIEAHRA